MEPKEVLRQFVEICDENSGLLAHYLASNPLVEWFGRSIRGTQKICRFYKYNFTLQYEHHFGNATHCESIEHKPSHFDTKKYLPPKERSRDSSSEKEVNEEKVTRNDFSTNLVCTPSPSNYATIPIVDHRRNKITLMRLNDVDLKDAGLSRIEDGVNCSSSSIGNQLIQKINYNDDEPLKKKSRDIDDLNKIEEETKVDRILPVNLPAKTSNFFFSDDKHHNMEREKLSKDEKLPEYNDLHYLEAVGVLRIRHKKKHRGIITAPQRHQKPEQELNEVDNVEIETTPNSFQDRKTRIRISYRFNSEDGKIQFVLILYEHLTRKPTTRRNLLAEFEKFEIDSEEKSGNFSNHSHSIKNMKEVTIKRKTPLKKMRLF